MIVVSFISGCAIPVREFPIAYTAQQSVQVIKDSDAVPVEVKVEDLQPDEFVSWGALNPISQKVYFRAKDAEGTIKGAVETELRARGFKIGSGGALVTIQLGRFEALCEDDVTGLTALGSISIRAQVQPPTGKVLYSREVEGEAKPNFARLYLRCAVPDSKERLWTDSSDCLQIQSSAPRSWQRVSNLLQSLSVQSVPPALSP